MHIARPKKIVLLGIMSTMPVPGVVWLMSHYLVGFERLGFETYYVEAHGMRVSPLVRNGADDAPLSAATFVAAMMKRLDLVDRWAFHARGQKRCLGMSAERLTTLYDSADLIINLHGGTMPLPEHCATGRLVYLETDPVELEIGVRDGNERALKRLEGHTAFFTWGLNYGRPDCRVPLDPRFPFRTTCPPVVLDFWEGRADLSRDVFTTVGTWRQKGTVTYEGEAYHWSKHLEFEKFLDLPERVGSRFELALNPATRTNEDVSRLIGKGWLVRDGFQSVHDVEPYRQYICESRGELTVAKDQNVRLRSGWFSERSACYLAAGRPVVTQDTGFGGTLPVGAGLFAFNSMNDLLAAFTDIESDYRRHRRAAQQIAREHFRAETVLSKMLEDLGV